MPIAYGMTILRRMPAHTLSDLCGTQDSIEEFGIVPREERIAKSLAAPRTPGALTPGQVNNITKARIRNEISKLVALELPEIQKALRELQADSPKAYLETVMQFMEFSLPKLKAMELDVSDNRENAKTMTLDDLQKAFGDSVVSTQ